MDGRRPSRAPDPRRHSGSHGEAHRSGRAQPDRRHEAVLDIGGGGLFSRPAALRRGRLLGRYTQARHHPPSVRRLYEGEVFEVDTPNAAITFESPGDYRIDVRPDGDTRLQVRSGRAVVAAGGGQIPIDGGEAMMIDGDQPPRYDFIPMGYPDGWDGWVSDREGRYRNVRSYQYVSHSIAGVEDLDTYGSWQRIPSYGWCWTPA